MLGLRPGELLGLSWEDVDFGAGTLRVRHSLKRIGGTLVLSDPKTVTSRRTLTMPAAVVTALKDHRKDQLRRQMKSGIWQDQGLVFPGRAGTPSGPGGRARGRALLGPSCPWKMPCLASRASMSGWALVSGCCR
jgi:integrase